MKKGVKLDKFTALSCIYYIYVRWNWSRENSTSQKYRQTLIREGIKTSNKIQKSHLSISQNEHFNSRIPSESLAGWLSLVWTAFRFKLFEFGITSGRSSKKSADNFFFARASNFFCCFKKIDKIFRMCWPKIQNLQCSLQFNFYIEAQGTYTLNTMANRYMYICDKNITYIQIVLQIQL